jgi:MFS family permease
MTREEPITEPVELAEAKPESKKVGTGSLLVIFLTVFIDLLGFGIVLPLLPIYATQFSTDEAGWTIGLLMASFSIMQFLFAPFWGSLSDRVGRRPVIIVGLAGSTLFYFLFGIAAMYKSLTGLFLTRIGAGIACATISTAQAYIADTTSNEDRSRGMALIGVAFGLGFTLGPLFALFAVNNGGGDPGVGPGFVASALSAVALALAVVILPESKTAETTNKAKKWWDGNAWKTAMSSKAIVFLLIGFFVCIFAFANFETTLSLLINGENDRFESSPFAFSYSQVCGTFAAIGLMVAIVQGGIVRQLSKRISEEKLAIAGAIIEVFGFYFLCVAVDKGSVNFLFGALAIIVAGYSCLQPSLYSLLSRWSDPREQGKVLGVGQSVSALARIFGSGLGIPMLKAFLILPYLLGSVLMFVVAGFIFWACRSGRDFEVESSKLVEPSSSET